MGEGKGSLGRRVTEVGTMGRGWLLACGLLLASSAGSAWGQSRHGGGLTHSHHGTPAGQAPSPGLWSPGRGPVTRKPHHVPGVIGFYPPVYFVGSPYGFVPFYPPLIVIGPGGWFPPSLPA